jgi:hypothetical protein
MQLPRLDAVTWTDHLHTFKKKEERIPTAEEVAFFLLGLKG